MTELALIGGKKLRSVVARVLSKLLSNQLAKATTLTGRGKNIAIALKEHKLFHVIKGDKFSCHVSYISCHELI